MTPITEPTIDELDELQKECNINEYGDIDENGHYIFKRFREILSDQVAKARIDELTMVYGDGTQHHYRVAGYIRKRIATLNGVKNK